jgi:3-hydroxyisobutyrate dehydrogenase-like beta-hydroxyacid dehydrogenase
VAACDVIVVGLGGMGSPAAHHFTARGHRVLGPENPRRLSEVTP